MTDSHTPDPSATVAQPSPPRAAETTVAQPSAPAAADATLTAPPRPPAAADGTQVQSAAPAHLFSEPGLPQVPGYAVLREVARGGMGVVFAARDPAFEREVAVKVMHPGQDAGRFVVESRVTAQLPHPGIPPVYALGALPDGRPFLAMKLIEGQTLADELKAATRADLPRLLGAFELICQTVGFAHARGIVHRDLKPANVMVGAFGEVLVMDWGLAKRVGGEDAPALATTGAGGDDETVAGQVKGTPAYMAPEQARGEPVDARADVFALGGILTATLTGKAPFGGTTVMDTVRRAAAADLAETLTRLDACGLDHELIAVAKRCLLPGAADRFADGEEVAVAVAAYRAGVEERLRRAERDRAAAEARAAEQRERRKIQLALAFSVMLLAAGVAGFAWWRDREGQRARRMEAEFEAAQVRDQAELKAVEAAAAERARSARELARRGVEAGLALAGDLRAQYRFKESAAALAHADEEARGAPELLPAVAQARADLAFVEQLDGIRYRKWTWVDEPGGRGHFNEKAAPPEYRRAFAARGLDFAALAPAEAAARLAASGVKPDLVAAVDDWALYEPDAALAARLLEVARRADPGAWSDRLRDPAVRTDRAAVAKLAADADPATTPPAALGVLSTLMQSHGLDPSPLLSAARARHPTSFELAFALAQWHSDAADGRQVAPYEAARALRPDNLTVLNNLGVALKARGDLPGAVTAFREVIRRDPGHAKAHNNLGVALHAAGKLTAAAAAFRDAVAHDPRLADAHNNLGATLKEAGDLDGALAAYREALKHDPAHAGAHNNLGNALHAAGDLAGALAAYGEAVRHDPKFALAHYHMGQALKDKGDLDGALAAYRAAVRSNPKLAPAHTNLGNLLYGKGDLDGAVAAYREAIRHDPHVAAAHNNLGAALRDKGDLDGAAAAFRDAVREDPRYAVAHFNLARVLEQKGDAGGALAAYRAAVKADPTLAGAHYRLGVLLRDGGQLDAAAAAFAEAVKRDPGLAAAHSDLGALYLRQGKYAAAAASARAAVKIDPRSANAHAILGLALSQLGDRPGTRAALLEAIRLDPKKWGPLLEKRVPPELAPPPREKK